MATYRKIANLKGPKGNGVGNPRIVGDDLVVDEFDGTVVSRPGVVVGRVRGATGATGERGATGETGARGPMPVVSASARSTTGDAGVNSSPTSDGVHLDFLVPRGDTGPRGVKGDKGDMPSLAFRVLAGDPSLPVEVDTRDVDGGYEVTMNNLLGPVGPAPRIEVDSAMSLTYGSTPFVNLIERAAGVYRMQVGIPQGPPGTASEAIQDDKVSVETSWSSEKTRAEIDAAKVTELGWDAVTGKPSVFKPESHSHSWGQVTGKPSKFEPVEHRHDASQIDGLVDDSTVGGKPWSSGMVMAARHEAHNVLPNGAGEWGGLGGIWGAPLTVDKRDVPAGETIAFASPAEKVTFKPEPVFVSVDPRRKYLFSGWMKADKPGTLVYIELRDQNGAHSVKSGTLGGGASYLVGKFEPPTEWTRFETVIELNPNASKVRIESVYLNHATGQSQDAVQKFAGFRLTPLPVAHSHEWGDIMGVVPRDRLPAASTSLAGAVRFATVSETETGEGGAAAVTPAGVQAAVDKAVKDAVPVVGEYSGEFSHSNGTRLEWSAYRVGRMVQFRGVIAGGAMTLAAGQRWVPGFPSEVTPVGQVLMHGAIGPSMRGSVRLQYSNGSLYLRDEMKPGGDWVMEIDQSWLVA